MSDTKQPEQKPSRRKFLAAAVTGSVGAAAAGFPMIAKAQAGPINMRWQSTWPAKDIFHEYALDFAKQPAESRRLEMNPKAGRNHRDTEAQRRTEDFLSQISVSLCLCGEVLA